MQALTPYLHLFETRAEWLVVLLCVAFCVGEVPARITGFSVLLQRGSKLAAKLDRKLNRATRGIATLVYRGIIALSLLLLPVIVGAIFISQPIVWLQWVVMLLLVLWFGQCFATHAGWHLWRRAKAEKTPLELPGLDYLFADHHAVLRYSIEARADAFAVGIVGACFWYLLLGLPGMAAYLVIVTANEKFIGVAFSWAARSLFRLVNFFPRLISRLLMVLAGFLTPRAHPLRAMMVSGWRGFLAKLLDVALGGPMPGGERAFIGKGTARLTPHHFRSALVLFTVASVWLVLLLASPTLYRIAIKVI